MKARKIPMVLGDGKDEAAIFLYTTLDLLLKNLTVCWLIFGCSI